MSVTQALALTAGDRLCRPENGRKGSALVRMFRSVDQGPAAAGGDPRRDFSSMR